MTYRQLKISMNKLEEHELDQEVILSAGSGFVPYTATSFETVKEEGKSELILLVKEVK